eukprot:TRINITY_DN3998_c0_g1_i1.p1 TRINITY_DN3998_c0_g1~~TRINITY_DN3998_c0_g1_i1.p1  ORF type:complete len:1172 (+),score=255.30 TRINITY_DN3998_c0_g1_i1:756-4271(+)
MTALVVGRSLVCDTNGSNTSSPCHVPNWLRPPFLSRRLVRGRHSGAMPCFGISRFGFLGLPPLLPVGLPRGGHQGADSYSASPMMALSLRKQRLSSKSGRYPRAAGVFLRKSGKMQSRREQGGKKERDRTVVRSLPLVAAAAAATTSGPHIVAAVTQVAVTAVAFVYGAYLSDEMLRRSQGDRPPVSLSFDGVDVTDFPIFKSAEVQKAVTFAREAHLGQERKTGEPYVTHCIHTGRILAALVPATGQRAIDTVVAGILHDVVDDTGRTLLDVKREFGDSVEELVREVSHLSHINQLLRRHRRTTAERNDTPNGLSPADVDSLRMMMLGMVNDPRVVLIKLADRLHNMRTIYALRPDKARAVAQETLAVWCSLASRLGVWAVKAELEDLCFAVLQPQLFRQLRAELALMWTPRDDWRHQRRKKEHQHQKRLSAEEYLEEARRRQTLEEDEELLMQDLLEAVLPFDVLLDNSRRGTQLGGQQATDKQAKVIRDAEVALAALGICEDLLSKEVLITTPYVPGTEVMLSGRLKSVYSAYCKMRRKGVGLDQVYDARALRVVVGDAGGALRQLAVEGCYNLLNVVHSLWTPVAGEFDDYIVNPKASGYQSLHTAVTGPDGAALEVQIRTQSMHEYAEFGHAAHWLYKESDSTPDLVTPTVTLVPVPALALQGTAAAAVTSPPTDADTPAESSGATGVRENCRSFAQPRVIDHVIAKDVHAGAAERDRFAAAAQNELISDLERSLMSASDVKQVSGEEAAIESRSAEGTPATFLNNGAASATFLTNNPPTVSAADLLTSLPAGPPTSPLAIPLAGADRSNGDAVPSVAAAAEGVEECHVSDDEGGDEGREGGGAAEGENADEGLEGAPKRSGKEGRRRGRREEAAAAAPPLLPSTWPVMEGHPALRIEEGRLFAAVVLRVDNDGRNLLVAVSFALRASEAVAAGRSGSQTERWATYAGLLHKVQQQWWNAPGHGDWSTSLEHYTLCRDGLYHKEDQYGYALKTFLQLLHLSPEEEGEYLEVVERVKTGQTVEGPLKALPLGLGELKENTEEAEASPTTATRLNNKVRLLRSMLQWEQEVRHGAATDGSTTALGDERSSAEAAALSEVLVIRWPGGEILRMPRGSDAMDVARRVAGAGPDRGPASWWSCSVLINSRQSQPHTKLRDGDIVEVRPAII